MLDPVYETRNRLLFWTRGQAPSEHLAAQLMSVEGYRLIDPIHPLGGPDGGKDALAEKDGRHWRMAAYFPRGEQLFSAIRDKFEEDLSKVEAVKADKNVHGMVFVTNQLLSQGERDSLVVDANESGLEVDLFHLERIVHILTRVENHATRSEFLGIPADGRAELPIPPAGGFFIELPSVRGLGNRAHEPRFNGVLALELLVRPTDPLSRHPDVSALQPRIEAAAARATAFGTAGGWPDNASLLRQCLGLEGWERPNAHLWTHGYMPGPDSIDSDSPLREGQAAAGFRTREVAFRFVRTWPMEIRRAGQTYYYAAREPEVVAESLVALVVASELLKGVVSGSVDVGVKVHAEPSALHLVSSLGAVSGGRFGEPSAQITPRHDVPPFHDEVGRFDMGELDAGYPVVDMLFGAWLSVFRDDLLERLRVDPER